MSHSVAFMSSAKLDGSVQSFGNKTPFTCDEAQLDTKATEITRKK